MEITRLGKTNPIQNQQPTNKQVTNSQPSFTEVMNRERQAGHFDRLQMTLYKIEDQGKRLAEYRTAEELHKYKGLVKDFIDETVHSGLQLEDERRVNHRYFKIVREIDENLVQLTNDIINKEANGLDILAQVGEIRGLLLNLYG